MFISSSEALGQTFDFAIVGSGPAGLTLAFEIERRKPDARILVLEFGGESAETKPNSLDDTIEIQNPKNHHEPYECTNKMFGGTSLTWGGRCVSYDEIDFLPRPVIGEECTWDISIFEDVKRHYAKAAEYLECGAPIFDLNELATKPHERIADKFKEGDVLDSPLERWSAPTRYASRYREQAQASKAISVVCGCLAKGLVKDDKGKTQVEIDGGVIRANKTILAAGAQESTRLLLKSPKVFPYGKLPDSLGRYYQGHISGKIASIKFSGDPKTTDYGFVQDAEGIYVRRRFQLPTSVLQRENLLNTAIWLDNPLYFDPSHRNGTMSFIYLMMITPGLGSKLAPPAIRESVTKGKKSGLGKHIGNILLGAPRSLYEPFTIFLGRYMSKRKLPGVFLYNKSNEYALHFHGEQVPLEDNRMWLSPDGKKLEIEYHYNDVDVDSVIRTHKVLDAWLRKTGSGELRYWYPENELADRIRAGSKDGIHQVGTTRISATPEKGVLDFDMKVWGNDDLYVCSSSAFPTSGQANPTYLLVAFACRLAEHLTK